MTSTTNETTTTTGASIHGLVEHCCAAWPERVALVSEQEEVTYGELNARANQLAAQLVAHGACQGQLTGLLLPRSTDFVISALAILKTGAAYLPMDPHYPPARLSAMIENAHPAAVVTSRRLRDALPAGLTVLYGDEPDSASASTVESGQPVPADCLAYVMYTSGSTGVPKGVMVPHRAVMRLVDGGDPANSFTRYGPEETLLLHSSLSFDAATYEMWGALVHGARLVIGPERPASLAELARLLRRDRVTQLFLTTGLFHLMVDEHLAELGVLRHLMTGGDVMSPARFRRAVAELPDTSVAHVYGPTECTTFATSFPAPAGWQPTGTVPIGRPIAQTTARILDEQLQPVPVGVSGQLFLGGDGLAHGYLNDPALTATRFVPDPHSPAPGARLYATGDRACYLPDGTIDFRGRVDEQVKIRGVRVEPGEIEQTLRRHPLVRDIAVVPTGDSAEDRRLAAFLVLANYSSGSAASGSAASGSAASDSGGGPAGIGPDGELTVVRGWLAAAVPAQLVPATWRRLPALPLNPNGKVDRGQLRALAGESRTSRASAGSTVGPEEDVIAAVYCEVLGLDRVNPGDDFFALGGHSLQAMKIAARLHRQLGVEVPLSALFDHTTVAGLAAYVRGGEREHPSAVT